MKLSKCMECGLSHSKDNDNNTTRDIDYCKNCDSVLRFNKCSNGCED